MDYHEFCSKVLNLLLSKETLNKQAKYCKLSLSRIQGVIWQGTNTVLQSMTSHDGYDYAVAVTRKSLRLNQARSKGILSLILYLQVYVDLLWNRQIGNQLTVALIAQSQNFGQDRQKRKDKDNNKPKTRP
jgi:hypothetical protein